PQCPLGGSLHGHHPRDCLFYLRDWAPPRLQELLRVSFYTGLYWFVLQKALGATFRDEPCGKETEPGHAGLCRSHYTEYLVTLINLHGLDPAPFYRGAELEAAALRHLP
ncbi:RNF31 ligase, partial [Poecile atricapillus]|nr:RNF31 ligase [Poecile atricapillus]